MNRVWRMCLVATATLLACAGDVEAGHEWSPYHLEFGGPRVAVHYVHLKTEFDADHLRREREFIETQHEICRSAKEAKILLGEDPGPPARPLPPGGIPAEPAARDVEIYYGAGRSVVVKTVTSYAIDIVVPERLRGGTTDDCSLDELRATTVTIIDGRRICTFHLYDGGKVRDYLKCKVDAKRLDAEAQWRAATGRDPRQASGDLPDPTGPTGEWRTFAGHRCRVFGPVGQEVDECIAAPDRLSQSLFSKLNPRHPGLLLQFRTKHFTDTARTVILNMEVGEKIFAIPKEGEPPELRRLAR